MAFQRLSDRADWHGVRALVRIDVNVPVDAHGHVVDDFRIRKATPTIAYLQSRGARVILLAHLGRKESETLEPIARVLSATVPVSFVPDIVGIHAQAAVAAMQPGDVIMLENVRQGPDEENDQAFARSLAAFADVFVNDAFSASHREHASIVGVARLLPSYAGLLFADEFDHLSQARTPEHPAVAIIGGAKFETKEPLIRTLLETYDSVFLGGALANDVLKARGYPVGASLVSNHTPADDVIKNPRLLAPQDVIVVDADGHARPRVLSGVAPDEKIVDIGPDSLTFLSPFIRDARYVLWNGPMGLYEDGYSDGTEGVVELITAHPCISIVGGGDTVAVIESMHANEKFTFLSTAGGAMLEFILKGTLPGIDTL